MKEANIHRSPCIIKGDLLNFEEVDGKHGIQKVRLNIRKLYPECRKREEFKRKFRRFLDSDCCNRKVIDCLKDSEVLTYRTECIIPVKTNSKPSLLLILGNPASHSVYSEMFFSFERKEGQEHRFWKALKKTGILSFKSALNRKRKEELYALSYDSPFRLGLAMFFSMPSGASRSKWAGVRGLRKLFGMKGLKKIAEDEKKRIERLIQKFVMSKGAIFVFQKDAYLEISQSTNYDYGKVREEGLEGIYRGHPNIRLFCLPPTRRMHLKKTRDILLKFKELTLGG